MKLVTSNVYWNLSSHQTTCGTCIDDSSLNTLGLSRCVKYPTLSNMLYLYKIKFRTKMEYHCHIWAKAGESTLTTIDRIQNSLRDIVGGGINALALFNLFPTNETLLTSPYSISVYTADARSNYIHLSRPSQFGPVIARTSSFLTFI